MGKTIKVVRCSGSYYWYANKLNETFNVTENEKNYFVKDGEESGKMLKKIDCVVLSDEKK